jgi:hypothetical protein
MSTTKLIVSSPRFNKTPRCELLPAKPAQYFTCQDGKWLFVSLEAPEKLTDYHFEIADFFKSPASTIDWLAHLSEKEWFDPHDFLAMIHRFRKATDSYGGL